MVVLDVGLEVLRQVIDAFRKDRYLNFRRACVAGFGRIGLDDVRLAVGCNRHRVSYLSAEKPNGSRAGMSSSAVAHGWFEVRTARAGKNRRDRGAIYSRKFSRCQRNLRRLQ